MPATEIAIAVVAVFGRVLVGQRAAGSSLAGYWEFPGGKVEQGESAEEAAQRECMEETGIEVEILAEYPSQQQTYEHGELLLRFFVARPCGDSIAPQGGFKWVDHNELATLQFPAGNQGLLKLLLEGT